jgi:hypothetical protein
VTAPRVEVIQQTGRFVAVPEHAALTAIAKGVLGQQHQELTFTVHTEAAFPGQVYVHMVWEDDSSFVLRMDLGTWQGALRSALAQPG